tara:strand:+ start:1441 stop:1860 length:420 start_codon:yes stop_codon:yes gene_type:complete
VKFYFYIIFIFASCNTIKDIKTTEPLISLQRTACFGECPIYKFEIYSSGDCIYYGEKFVNKIGEYKFQLKKKDIDIIISMSKEINFKKMDNRYTSLITDLPTTYIKIKNKKIIDYSDAPKELKDLEKLIDEICFKAINK